MADPNARRIPWLRVFVESFVIVVSILLAFGIDAWWDVRQQEEHFRTALAGLESGYAEHLRRIDANIDYVSNDQQRLRSFINMDPLEASRIPAESTWGTLQSIWRPGTEDNNITFLTSALADESLALRGDVRLHEAVAAWQTVVDELRERVVQMAVAEREALRAVARYPGVRSALARPSEGDPGGPPTVNGEVMRRVREDQEVMAVAGMKIFHSRIHRQTLRELRVAAELVLDLVRAAQSR